MPGDSHPLEPGFPITGGLLPLPVARAAQEQHDSAQYGIEALPAGTQYGYYPSRFFYPNASDFQYPVGYINPIESTIKKDGESEKKDDEIDEIDESESSSGERKEEKKKKGKGAKETGGKSGPDQKKKKLERNRASAKESRRKRKVYIQNIEEEVQRGDQGYI